MDLPLPRYEHDCKECVYLGHHGAADLYAHPSDDGYRLGLTNGTVIARYSSDGPDYQSGLSFIKCISALGDAFARAQQRGMFTHLSWDDAPEPPRC